MDSTKRLMLGVIDSPLGHAVMLKRACDVIRGFGNVDLSAHADFCSCAKCARHRTCWQIEELLKTLPPVGNRCQDCYDGAYITNGEKPCKSCDGIGYLAPDGGRLEIPRAKKPFVKDPEKAREAERVAAHWLYRGNKAKERGDLDMAERHFARSQKHHDEMNRYLGNGDGSG